MSDSTETKRLNALYATGLLDSGAEERFDRFARLAANMLGTKLAFVSLIDSDIQYFKAREGTDISQTARDIAFCDHAIRTPDTLMIVADAREDARFADNPLVTGEMGVRFYAGQPLVTKSGYAIGSICVLDDKPRPDMAQRERAALADLAASVMAEIEHSEAIEDLSVMNAELKHRMGNMYAHIGSLISLIARGEPDKDRLVQRLQEKIASFGSMQQLLSSKDWKSVGVRELVEAVLQAYRSGRPAGQIVVHSDGDVQLSPRGAFILTLMVGELATNAVKHGALGLQDGTIEFGWSTVEGQLVFQWHERFARDGAAMAAGTGFGTEILRKIVPMDMRGTASLDFTDTGMLYRVSARPERICQS